MSVHTLILIQLLFYGVSGFRWSNCYDLGHFCFGIKGRVRSFGPNGGCIKHNDCNILLIGIQDDDYYRGYKFTLQLPNTYPSSIGKFSISKNAEPFDLEKGYYFAEIMRTPETLEPREYVNARYGYEHSVNGIKTFLDCSGQEHQIVSKCIRYTLHSSNDTFTSADFLLQSWYLQIRELNGTYHRMITINDTNLYVHLQRTVGLQHQTITERQSYDQPISLFSKAKTGANVPFTEPIDEPITTTSTEFPTTILATTIKIDPTTKTTELTTIPTTTESKPTIKQATKKLETKWIIIISLVVAVIAIILIAFIYHFCCRKKQMKRSVKKNNKRLK